jgi:hypothetical protein
MDGCGVRASRSSQAHQRELPRSSTPRVYVCVYRQFIPENKRLLRMAAEAATNNPDLRSLLDRLHAGNTAYDWGDDPSFFSATYHQGQPTHAGWGVCRANVRRYLYPGDMVVYFCARRGNRKSATKYLFVGYGTVGQRIDDRRLIWTEPLLQSYRNHLNVLVRYEAGQAIQHERFEPGHDDWEHRARSPYLIFDASASSFNLVDPLHVATALPGAKKETWHCKKSQKVRALHELLFKNLGVPRTLRTSFIGTAHPPINLTERLMRRSISIEQLRSSLHPFTAI